MHFNIIFIAFWINLSIIFLSLRFTTLSHSLWFADSLLRCLCRCRPITSARVLAENSWLQIKKCYWLISVLIIWMHCLRLGIDVMENKKKINMLFYLMFEEIKILNCLFIFCVRLGRPSLFNVASVQCSSQLRRCDSANHQRNIKVEKFYRF